MNSRLILLAVSAVALTGANLPTATTAPAAAPLASAAVTPVVAVPAPAPAPSPSDLKDAAVSAALEALEATVRQKSDASALRRAFNAYYSFKAAHPERVRNPYLYFVDYGFDNRTPRGYVFNMEKLTLVDGPFIVAHGRGSSAGKNAVPMRFSNAHGSASTSLGLYVAQETYSFSGHAGGQLYHSIGLRMAGVSGRFNSNARARGVVVHGAPYVTPGGSGRSEGCPAMEQDRARRLIPKIANGGLVFLFSPNDPTWLDQDPWANSAD